MQDAAAWLFPSTEGSRAAALLQPQPKSKQLTQRFNHFFRRKKPNQASSEEGVSQPDSDVMLGGEEDRIKGQQPGLAQEQGQGPDALGQPSRADARSSLRPLPQTGQAGTAPQQQLPSSPASDTELPQTGPEDSVQQPKQAAAAQAESTPDSRGQTAPLKEGFLLQCLGNLPVPCGAFPNHPCARPTLQSQKPLLLSYALPRCPTSRYPPFRPLLKCPSIPLLLPF